MKHLSRIAAGIAAGMLLLTGPAGAAQGQQGGQQQARQQRQQAERARVHEHGTAQAGTQDRERTQSQQRAQAPQQAAAKQQGIYGGNLMTAEERNRYREELGGMKTDQERNLYIERHRERMQARSKERGIAPAVTAD